MGDIPSLRELAAAALCRRLGAMRAADVAAAAGGAPGPWARLLAAPP